MVPPVPVADALASTEAYAERNLQTLRNTSIGNILALCGLSVPCGFTGDGLPVGLQIVGRHQQDFAVLQLAHAFEQATGFWKTRPTL